MAEITEGAPLPTVVEELDRLRIQLYDEKIKALELQAAAIQSQHEKLAAERKQQWNAVSQKYSLGEKDSFHRDTGVIKRGE